jgi:CRP-like cAMP-binding protein
MSAWPNNADAHRPDHGPDIPRETELFADPPGEIGADLAGHCRWHTVAPGHLLIDAPARRPHGVFILAAGDVEIFRDDGGAAVPLATLAAIDCFGEFAAIRGEPGSASVRSLSSCMLGEMPSAVFTALLARQTCFSMRLLRRVVDSVRSLDAAVVGAQRRNGSDHASIRELYRDLALRSL